MSRIDFDDMWEHHNGKAKTVMCPCCGIWRIHKEAVAKNGRLSRDWVRGHIIHHKNLGPDIYENVRPICHHCNKHDEKYDSNYHYMTLALNRMTLVEADQGVKAIWAMYKRQQENLDMVRCLGCVQSTGEACTKKRKPHSYFCTVHGKKADQQLRWYLIKIMKQELDLLWEKYYYAGIDKDEERSEHLAEVIDRFQDLIDDMTVS